MIERCLHYNRGHKYVRADCKIGFVYSLDINMIATSLRYKMHYPWPRISHLITQLQTNLLQELGWMVWTLFLVCGPTEYLHKGSRMSSPHGHYNTNDQFICRQNIYITGPKMITWGKVNTCTSVAVVNKVQIITSYVVQNICKHGLKCHFGEHDQIKTTLYGLEI